MAVLCVCAWLTTTFVAPKTSGRHQGTAMRGFKDDFYAWKDTLSSEDQERSGIEPKPLGRQALLLKQAQNEFNKKFRGTDEFKTYLSEDKIGSFGKVLQKFFDNELDDYKKEVEQLVSGRMRLRSSCYGGKMRFPASIR